MRPNGKSDPPGRHILQVLPDGRKTDNALDLFRRAGQRHVDGVQHAIEILGSVDSVPHHVDRIPAH